MNSQFSPGFVPDTMCWVPPASSPRQRFSGGSYSIKTVFEQVATFQAGFGGASKDFPHGTPGRKGADGWRGWEDGLLSLPLRDHPAWSRQETPSPLLFTQVFLWYLPLTGPLGVWKWQHRAECAQENIPTPVTESWEQSPSTPSTPLLPIRAAPGAIGLVPGSRGLALSPCHLLKATSDPAAACAAKRPLTRAQQILRFPPAQVTPGALPAAPELLKRVPAAAGKPRWGFHRGRDGPSTAASRGSPVEPAGPGWQSHPEGISPECSGTLVPPQGFGARAGVCSLGEAPSCSPGSGEVKPRER